MTKPRRSVLYMPGANARALEKARTLPADALIFDLEDAVAPAAKDQARAQVVAALKAGGYGARETIIRVNGPETPWGEADIAAAMQAPVDVILLPKVENPDQVLALAERAGHESGPDIWCMIETPLGVLRAGDIAASHERLTALVMGTTDLVSALHARHTPGREPLLAALGHCVLAARAHQLTILDGVHLDLDDMAGFEAACRQGRDLGFDGKTLIHPKTIEAANSCFAPTGTEIEDAHRLVQAFEDAMAEGRGVTVLDGRLIEAMHVSERSEERRVGKECRSRWSPYH